MFAFQLAHSFKQDEINPLHSHTPAHANAHTHTHTQVLVDAECTHDGSLRHIAKFQQWGWPTFERRVLGAKRLRALAQLQRGLLLNGFRLLKPGGVLIYATCRCVRACVCVNIIVSGCIETFILCPR